MRRQRFWLQTKATPVGPPTGTLRLNAGYMEEWESGDAAAYLGIATSGYREIVSAAPTLTISAAGYLEEKSS